MNVTSLVPMVHHVIQMEIVLAKQVLLVRNVTHVYQDIFKAQVEFVKVYRTFTVIRPATLIRPHVYKTGGKRENVEIRPPTLIRPPCI